MRRGCAELLLRSVGCARLVKEWHLQIPGSPCNDRMIAGASPTADSAHMHHAEVPAVLITMPHSHYAEKARWALDRLRIPYQEEPHVPLVHRLATRRQGGGSVPVFVQGRERFVDSTEILRHADASCGGDRLYPRDGDARRAVEALEERFDNALGPHTRRWAYFQLLPRRALLHSLMARGVPRTESSLLNLTLPIVVFAIRKGLRITPQGAQRSIEQVRGIFREVDDLLADGRRYLVEDRFTAADLTFAALASPVLLPERGIAAYPSVDKVPDAMREAVERLRDTEAGRFALRMYALERWCPAPVAP
jgi:glutathione S-transferase